MAPGAAGDLAKLRRGQKAMTPAVEFPVRGEGDVIDIEIETHANGVGRDDVIDVAGLKQFDLGVAGARAQGSQHNRRAPALALDPFSDGVNLLRRKRDDRRARRQARDFPIAGEGEFRQARPAEQRRAGKQFSDQRRHRARADQQCFLAAAPAQQPVSENMAAIEVGGELNFIDGEEIHGHVARHRLDGADPVGWRARFDLLLASNQSDVGCADLFDDPRVDFARQQAQRQTDQPAGEGQHPLNSVMSLAGVGRPEHRRDARGADVRATARQWRLHRFFMEFDRRSAPPRSVATGHAAPANVS